MKQYYKVVREDNGRLISAMGHYLPQMVCAEYAQGEWTTANYKGARLFVFDDKQRADEFKWGQVGHYGQLWECNIRGIPKPAQVLFPADMSSIPDAKMGRFLKLITKNDTEKLIEFLKEQTNDGIYTMQYISYLSVTAIKLTNRML